MTKVRGIRGAISARENTKEEIFAATRELLETLVRENSVEPADVASIFFTVTCDLNAAFPALAARRMGWDLVPMMCATEIPVPGSLPRVIRTMLHVNTSKNQSEIKHIYLREAMVLRPDLAAGS